ncbi:hypothetical protein A2U01_0013758, partial [Trifolium medium]|nr:hypothetical protein [Trifolium medium]
MRLDGGWRSGDEGCRRCGDDEGWRELNAQ